MNQNTHIATSTVWTLISDAGAVGKTVLLLLFIASAVCWAIIYVKRKTLKRALNQNVDFLNIFWHGKSIDDVYARTDQFPNSPIAAVFKSGFSELKKLSPSSVKSDPETSLNNIQRSLLRASNNEIAGFEKHLIWLATTASAAPFVGLFGTVWGIMTAFQNIGAQGSANLAVVAPGISEALITTATGIAAAIPAVIAYNYFGSQIKRATIEIENFSQDFLNIVQRSFKGSHINLDQ